MKILATTLLFMSFAVSASPTRIVDGNYLRYEATEYESMFFPCQSTEVWSIDGGNALDALVDYYRNSPAHASGEIRTALMLNVSPIDRTEHPGTQIDAVARVIAIISLSNSEDEIVACREKLP